MNHRFRRIALATVLAATLASAARGADNITLPDLGDESTAAITPAQERRLGEDFMRQARKALPFVDDAEANAYIQTLGSKLVARSDQPYQNFRFFIIDDPTINAFAVPGGFIGVHTGLILNSRSESELASVLAHETVHVTQRHIPRMMVEQQQVSLGAMAAILASILVASSGHQGGEAGIALTQAAMAQHQINFTRLFEEEADRIGMDLLARSGFDPRAMPSFFERLQNANRYNETNLPEFLRTHPVTTNRISDSRGRAERYPAKAFADSLDFQLVRAKLRALNTRDPADAVRGFRDNLAQGKFANAAAEHYGYALALKRAGDFAGARAEIGKLVARYPEQLAYQSARAEIEMAAGNFSEAVRLYAAANRKAPGSIPIARQYTAALLKTGNAREAKNTLGPILRQHPDDPALNRMMAEAAGALNERATAHRAMAEYYYLSGNPQGALEQLQLASKFAGDSFYVQSSVEARIQAIKEELKLAERK